MVKTLDKHGDDYALVIDNNLLELLKIGPDTPLILHPDGRSMFITPADDADDEQFRSAIATMKNRYGNMLKKLGD